MSDVNEGALKLSIAGRDRSDDIGRELSDQALRRQNADMAGCMAREEDVLVLKKARDTADYLDKHVGLMRARNCVDPSLFDIPSGGGVRGAIVRFVRKIFWGITRWQCERSAFDQNAINIQLTYELEFEKEARAKDVAELSARVRKLEAMLEERGKK